jgi:hypothetical protein
MKNIHLDYDASKIFDHISGIIDESGNSCGWSIFVKKLF